VGVKFKVTGVDKVVRKLRQFEPKVQRQAVSKATRAGAKLIQAEAKANVPVDTGALKEAIKVRAPKKRKKGKVATLVQVGAGDFKGDTFYGGMIEFGTSKMTARPFMTPAFETKGAEARDVAIAELGRAIDQILRKMSVSGRFVDKVSKSKVLKSARKSVARKAKAVKKSAARKAKVIRKSTSKGLRKAGKSATRQAKKARKAASRRVKRARKTLAKSVRKRRR
jgi:HK97 gp10 family phage protein